MSSKSFYGLKRRLEVKTQYLEEVGIKAIRNAIEGVESASNDIVEELSTILNIDIIKLGDRFITKDGIKYKIVCIKEDSMPFISLAGFIEENDLLEDLKKGNIKLLKEEEKDD